MGVWGTGQGGDGRRAAATASAAASGARQGAGKEPSAVWARKGFCGPGRVPAGQPRPHRQGGWRGPPEPPSRRARQGPACRRGRLVRQCSSYHPRDGRRARAGPAGAPAAAAGARWQRWGGRVGPDLYKSQGRARVLGIMVAAGAMRQSSCRSDGCGIGRACTCRGIFRCRRRRRGARRQPGLGAALGRGAGPGRLVACRARTGFCAVRYAALMASPTPAGPARGTRPGTRGTRGRRPRGAGAASTALVARDQEPGAQEGAARVRRGGANAGLAPPRQRRSWRAARIIAAKVATWATPRYPRRMVTLFQKGRLRGGAGGAAG
jgi:hypothetical protein